MKSLMFATLFTAWLLGTAMANQPVMVDRENDLLKNEDFTSLSRASRNLQFSADKQLLVDLPEETGFHWRHLGNQQWALELFVIDTPLTINSMNVDVVWNARSFTEIIQVDGDDAINLQSNAILDFELNGWRSGGDDFSIALGLNIFPGPIFVISNFTYKTTIRPDAGYSYYTPSNTPYRIGVLKAKDGFSYEGWQNMPKVHFHSFFNGINSIPEITSPTHLPIKHSNNRMIDANDDFVQDFEDYRIGWNFFNNQSVALNLSMFQFFYDPRLDVDQDGFFNFLDVRALGKRLNDGNFVGDVNGDNRPDQEDFSIVLSHLGRTLFPPGVQGYDQYYPWQADLNGDLVVDLRDAEIVLTEIKYGKTYY